MTVCLDQDFALWAFGDAWEEFLSDASLGTMDLFNAWNALHGDIILLQQDSMVIDDLNTLKEMWKLYGQKDAQGHAEDEGGRKGHEKGQVKTGSCGAKGRRKEK